MQIASKLRAWQKRLMSLYHHEGIWSFELNGEQFSVSGIDSMSLMNNRTNFLKETEMVENMLHAVDANNVFWDVGTDIGLYTVVVGRYAGLTVGFEPYAMRRLEARQNCIRNGVDAEIHDTALGDGSELPANSVDGANEYRTVVGDNWRDDTGVPAPDVLKMDIDGGEYAALQNLEETLAETSHLYCEVHPTMMPNHNSEDVRQLLSDYGFHINLIGSRGTQEFIHATRE